MEKAQLLYKELEIVQSEIARFDSNGLSIKEWSVGIWGGLVAFGYSSQVPAVIIASMVSTVVLAYAEFIYRRFQERFIARSKLIEDTLKKGSFSEYNYGVYSTATTAIKGETLQALKQPQFFMFYLLLVVMAAVAFLHLTLGN